MVALLVPVLVGDDWVVAQKVEPTDTTAAAGSGSGTRDHDPSEQPPNCSHGEVTINPGTDNERVKCRACARRTYAVTNSGPCRAVSPTPACNAQGLVKHAIVSSWPEECVPIYRPTFNDPRGNPPPEDQGEWRNLTTGNCIDVCGSGRRWSTARKRCVTATITTSTPTTTSTTTTTMASTGRPKDLDYNAALEVMPCGTYSAEQDAAWYLNTARYGGALTDPADTTH